MERCIWLSPDSLPADGWFSPDNLPTDGWLSPDSLSADGWLRDIDTVFIGDEACGLFLSGEALPLWIDEIIGSGKGAGIVLPYLTPEREEDFIKLLGRLARPVKIAVNDFGAFRLVRQSAHTLVIGRLLAKQNTDPAIITFYEDQPGRIVYDGMERAKLTHAAPPESLTAHFTGVPAFSDETAALFLAGGGEISIILDRLPHGLPASVPGGFNVLLNTENILVSILPCRSCEGCPDKETYVGATRAGAPIYRRRNTCYCKYSECGIKREPGEGVPGYVAGTIVQPLLS